MFLDGREKLVCETLNSLSWTNDVTKEDKVLVHFYKLDSCGGIASVEHNTPPTTVATVQKGKKRRLSGEVEEQSIVPLAKRQSLSALSAEDLDLLNSY